MNEDSSYPLAGLRVLDISRALAGPYAGRIFSDLGADVVKVSIPSGDVSNSFGEVRQGVSGLYTQLNVGKRSVAADPATDVGAETVRELVCHADVLIENFRPGVMAARGIGWEELRSINPRLVMLSISGFGQDGPEAERQAYAPVVHAESSMIGRQGEFDERPPVDIVLALSDGLAGLHGTIAVLAALRVRDASGVGQHIDMSMLEAMLASDENMHFVLDDNLPIWPARGIVFQVTGNRSVVIAGDPKMVWDRLQRRHGLTDPTKPGEPLEAKIANRWRVMCEWVASYDDWDAVTKGLEAADLAWGQVRTPATLLDSPSLKARPIFTEVDDRAGGLRRVVRLPYRFSDARTGVRGPVALVGEHTEDVLSEWCAPDSEVLQQQRQSNGEMA